MERKPGNALSRLAKTASLPQEVASYTAEEVRKLQMASLKILLVLQALLLINGFPTKEDVKHGHAVLDTFLNISTEGRRLLGENVRASRAPGGDRTDLSAVQYTETGDLLAEARDGAMVPESAKSGRGDYRGQIPNLESDATDFLLPHEPSSSSSMDSLPPWQSEREHPLELGGLGRQKHRHSDNKRERYKQASPEQLTMSLSAEEQFDEPSDDEEGEDVIPVEQRLMNVLMRHYERSVRPVKNASETVLVRMGLTLTQIFDMDEKNQVLVTNVWLDQEWDDMFLRWSPEDYGGLEILRLPCHKLWLPDIVLYNNAAEYTDGLMPANAMITYQGNVFWPVPTKLQSTCKVDVTYFPFDDQYCRLKFGSWTYDGFQVDMVNRTTEVDLSNYVQNGEWELVEIQVQRNVVFYACCPEPFPDVTFILHIRRRTLYYMYNVIFPCIMMSALTLLVFCLPPDSGEKITMGITVLLAFSVFMLTIAEDLPETSEFIPLLSIYLTIVMAMTSVSVIMTVFVLNLHHRGPNNRPVPAWLRRIFLRRRVRRGLCFSARTPVGAGDNSARFVDEYLTDGHSNYVKNVSLRLTIENLAQELKEELDSCAGSGADFGGLSLGPPSAADTPSGPQIGFEPLYHEVPQVDLNNRRPTAPGVAPGGTAGGAGGSGGPYSRHYCTKTNEDILNALKKIIERYERDDSEEEVMYEWRQVALAVDRILFWIFLFGTLASTIVVLIVAPITKWL